MTRSQRIEDLIGGTQAAEDGQLEDFIASTDRFFYVEYDDEDYPLFAGTAETLEETARHIDDSETHRDHVTVYDLETGDEWTPQLATIKFHCEASAARPYPGPYIIRA